jgi:hypothetical protein
MLLAAIAALCLARIAAAQELNATQASAVTLSSIQPPKLSVNLAYMIDGKLTTMTSCANDDLGAACLPKLQAADTSDKVFITYSVLPAFTPNASDTVQLKACYSNYSQVDRPWRATNNIISKSKKCPFVIKAGLSPVSGNATWSPKEVVPTATYFVRAFVMHNSSATVQYQVALGSSKGYFQVNGINSRPKSMKIAAGLCACVGPLMFVGYFCLTYLRKKNV